MQAVFILALLAVASSTPLGWITGDNLQSFQFGRVNNRFTPAQQSAQQIGREIQQAQNVIEQGLGYDRVIKSDVAQQAAREVVEQALLARQGQTIEGIQDLEQPQRTNPQNIVERIATNEAIDNLQNQLVFQRNIGPVVAATSQLGRTLEAAIESQLTLDNVDVQQWGRVGQSDLNSKVFLAKVEQLVDENIIQEIQTEISRQQAKIQQLQQQKVLVDQQKQQIQVQLIDVQQIGDLGVQLEQVQQQLQRQGEELIGQQLARQLVIQQLQQALIEQQQQLQRDILGELQSESWEDASNQIRRGVGINRISSLAQRVPVSRQYEDLRTQVWNPYSISGNSWSRFGNDLRRSAWVA
ncbi:hypothetical protein HUJ04_003792 [Dendroctonus ponderosae]